MPVSTPEWYRDQRDLTRQLLEGRRCELMVALELLLRGCTVRLGTLELFDHVEHRVDYADDFDLQANGVDVEVKGRTCRFTSVDDFPFDTLFLGTLASWRGKRKADRLPAYVVVVSEPTGAMVAVPTSSASEWRVEEGRCKTTHEPLPSIAAPKACAITFEAFVEELGA